MLLYVSPIDISLPNGPGVNEREFVAALARRFGESVHFLLPLPRDSTVMDGLPNVRAFYLTRPRLLHWVNQITVLFRLLQTTRKLRPGLVVVRAGQLPLGLAIFARLSSVPLALKTQGDPTMQYLCEKPGFKGALSRLLRPVNLWAMQSLVDRAVSIDCCTPQLIQRNMQFLRDVPREKMLLIENATNVERFQPGLSISGAAAEFRQRFSPTVGYVGGVPWERGGEHIIRAVASLRATHPRLGAAIVGGEGEGLERLRRLASNLDVKDCCLVVGQVPYDEVPAWISSFDVGVAMDSEEHISTVGSSNQKIRQYLACGKPVLASNGVNEFLVLHELGLTVSTADQPGFTVALASLLSDVPGRSADVSGRARRYAEENFSIDSALASRVDRWHQAGVRVP